MSNTVSWKDVKAKARSSDPTWEAEERARRRGRMREEMVASVSGAQLAAIRTQHSGNDGLS